MSLIHLARQGFITKSALPSVTRTRGASYQPSLLLLGDGANNSTTIVDSSQNAFAITRYGDTKISTTQKPTGMTSSIYFDGTGDYLSLSDNALFDFGSGDFTVETNIYLNSLTSQQQIIGQWGALSSSSSFTLNVDTTSIIAAVVSTGFTYYVYTATVTLSINQWYHIAFVRYNNALKIFLNGKQIGSDVSVSGVTVNSTPTNPILICYKEDNNQYINGYISNLRIVKGTALYTKNFFVPTLPLSTFAQQKAYPDLLLLGSGTNGSTTITDSSPNAFTITRNGDTNISTAQYPVGMTSSIYFDGTGDYLSVANNAAFNFGTGSFTVEGFFRLSSTGTARCITSNYQDSSNGWAIEISNTNYLVCNLSGDVYDITGTTAISTDTWYHFALSGASGSIRLFLNGVQEGSTYTGAVALNSTQATTVGGLFWSGTLYDAFAGYLSNIRITKGTALYTGKFNVPLLPLPSSSTSPGASPSLYITGDGINNSTNIIDRSPNAFTVTVNGDTKISTAQEPTGMVSSIYFDGTGDYLSVANNAAFSFGTGDFTIECLVRFNSVSSIQSLLGNYSNSTTGWGLQWRSDTGNWNFFYGDTALITYTNTPTTNSWVHVAVTRSGTNLRLFLDGVLVNTQTNSTTLDQTSTLYIGGLVAVNVQYFAGYLSNIRITKGAALYTTTFVPPPLPILLNSNQIAYPSLLLRGAGANNSTTFTDSSPNAFTVTAFGDAKISTAQYPTGMSSSMYFDGTGDYLQVANNAAFDFGTGDFTIECYVNLSSTTIPVGYISQYVGPATGWHFRSDDVNKFSFGWGDTEIVATSSWNRSTGVWDHIAVSRTGTTIRLFLNGLLLASATNSTNLSGASATLKIAALAPQLGYANWYFNGYLSNVRIIKGTALYRSNFTPPPLPASATPQTDLTPATTASTITNNVYGVYQLA